MQHLVLKKRPARHPVFRSTLWLAFVSLVIMALGAGTTIADAKHHFDVFMYASIALVVWAVTAGGLYLDRDYNRSLPGILERYLNSNLDEDDYEQLRQAALQHPAIRPWISGCIKNGDLTYQDAEPLVARINQYMAEHQAPYRQPPVVLNSQQKLLQLLQGGTAAGESPIAGPRFVSVKLKTAGGPLIYAHRASH